MAERDKVLAQVKVTNILGRDDQPRVKVHIWRDRRAETFAIDPDEISALVATLIDAQQWIDERGWS